MIAVSSGEPVYRRDQSRYFGSVRSRRLRLVFSFYSPDGNEIAMPIASMSAYLKREFPDVEVLLAPILILRDAERYSPVNFARHIESLNADLIAFSVMSPHWYPMQHYFAELKRLQPSLPILIGGYQAMLSQDETIANPHIDYICVGDGEYAIGNMVRHLRGEAGCHTIWFGIESGDEEYRAKMLGRKMTNRQVIDAADNCKKAGIFRLTFNIVGAPLESAENMRRTLALNKRIAPEFFFFPYIPLRGTPLYKIAKQEGLLIKNKKNLHYLSAVNDRKFTLNMKERPELLTQQEYHEICMEMLAFQQTNNRLSYTVGNAVEDDAGEDCGPAPVQDKSFQLAEDAPPVTAVVAAQRKKSIFSEVRGFFSR